MRVDRVVVIMVVVVIVVMIVVMVVVVGCRQAAHASTEGVAVLAIGHVGAGGGGALALNMVVVGFLDGADFGFKAEDLGAVFAEHAGWRWRVGEGGVFALVWCDVFVVPVVECQHLFAVAADAAVGGWVLARLFNDAFGEGFQHFWVIAQVAGFDELDVGVLCGDLVGEAVDAVDQDAGEQEVGRNDDAFVAQACCVGQARFDQREGDAGVADLEPTKADAFLQHAGDFSDVAVCVRVGCATTDDNQAGVVEVDVLDLVGGGDRVFDATRGSGDHFRVNAEFAAVGDFDTVFGGVGVEDRGDVIFGMHRSEQHAGNGEDAGAAAGPKFVEAVADDGVGKFKVAVFGLPIVREIGGEFVSQCREFIDSGLRARAVAADHDASFGRGRFKGVGHAGASSLSWSSDSSST